MSITTRIKTAGIELFTGSVSSTLVNLYEAAKRWSSDRSTIPGALNTARIDVSKATREEILRKAIYFEANNFIANRLADVFEQYVVGANGIKIIPNSSSPEYNKAAAEYWESTSGLLDLTSRKSTPELQSLSARNWFMQGECFIEKTRGDTGNRARIRMWEGMRVKSPNGNSSPNVFDGIELDDYGRPVAYYIEQDNGNFKRVEAQFIEHIFEPSRIGQYRGLSFFYPVLNMLHDLDDLHLLEMRAAKLAAEIANVIETPSGTGPSAKDIRRSIAGIVSKTTDNEDTTKQIEQFFQTKYGGSTLYTLPGMKVQQFKSDRPSAGVQWHWDYLLTGVCSGTGISRTVAFPESMQGTVVRADLDAQNTFFRNRAGIVSGNWVNIYRYVINDAAGFESALSKAKRPTDWAKVVVRPPRSVNVDVGRNSNALIQELQAHVRTYQSVFAELGEDWTEQLKQAAIEAKYISQLETDNGLQPGSLAAKAQQQIAQQIQTPPPQGGAK